MEKWFCCDLKKAAIIIGWLDGTLSVLGVILYLILIKLDDDGTWVQTLNPTATAAINEHLRRNLDLIFISMVVSNIISLITDFCLVIGAMKDRHLLMLPWLAVVGISMLTTLSYFMLMLLPSVKSSSDLILPLVIYSISLVFYLYMWLAVFTLYRNVKTNNSEAI